MRVVLEIARDDSHLSLRREADFRIVPRVGEWVELADGWASELVKSVTWAHDGEEVTIALHGKLNEEDVVKLLREGWRP